MCARRPQVSEARDDTQAAGALLQLDRQANAAVSAVDDARECAAVREAHQEPEGLAHRQRRPNHLGQSGRSGALHAQLADRCREVVHGESQVAQAASANHRHRRQSHQHRLAPSAAEVEGELVRDTTDHIRSCANRKQTQNIFNN